MRLHARSHALTHRGFWRLLVVREGRSPTFVPLPAPAGSAPDAARVWQPGTMAGVPAETWFVRLGSGGGGAAAAAAAAAGAGAAAEEAVGMDLAQVRGLVCMCVCVLLALCLCLVGV